MEEAERKRPSIVAVVVCAALVVGPLLPWIVIKAAEDSLALCPGCALWDARAARLFEIAGVSLWLELTLFVVAGLLALAAGFLEARARLAAGLSMLLAFVASGLVLFRTLGAVVAAGDRIADMPDWAQAWVADGVGQIADLTSLGYGSFVSLGALVGAVFLFVRLAPEGESDTSWLTPLAQRFWFFELIEDFWFFLRERKAWWMTPIVVVLLLLVVLILVGEKAAVLPFIYTIF